MNQILATKLVFFIKKKKKFYKVTFCVSFFLVLIFIGFIIYNLISIKQYEKISNELSNNYNIYKLYSKYSEEEIKNKYETENEIFGIIEIPNINIKYPIFSKLTDKLLKISPCKFYGNSPKEDGNLCIAGHNYDNSKFFSNLSLLDINDKIYIYDNLNNKYVYTVFKIYEVNDSDLSPIFDYNKFSKELTLITCNNFNQNRLVVKSSQNKNPNTY